MEYHYVVCWSEEDGWRIDHDTTAAKFIDGNVWVPNLSEWVKAVDHSETGNKDVALNLQLQSALDNLNK